MVPVHCAICLFSVYVPVFAGIHCTYRLSWLGWPVTYWNGLPFSDGNRSKMWLMTLPFLVLLRSGYCTWLNLYRHQLNPAVPDTGPDCNTIPQCRSSIRMLDEPSWPDFLGPLAVAQEVPQHLITKEMVGGLLQQQWHYQLSHAATSRRAAWLFIFLHFCVCGNWTDADKLRINNEDEVSVYMRRWRPSKYQLDEVVEVIADENSYEDLVTKVCAF